MLHGREYLKLLLRCRPEASWQGSRKRCVGRGGTSHRQGSEPMILHPRGIYLPDATPLAYQSRVFDSIPNGNLPGFLPHRRNRQSSPFLSTSTTISIINNDHQAQSPPSSYYPSSCSLHHHLHNNPPVSSSISTTHHHAQSLHVERKQSCRCRCTSNASTPAFDHSINDGGFLSSIISLQMTGRGCRVATLNPSA